MSGGKAQSLFSGVRSARALGARGDRHNGSMMGKTNVAQGTAPNSARPSSNAARSGNGAPPRAIPRPQATADRPQKRDFRGMFDSDSDGDGSRKQRARIQKGKSPAKDGQIISSQKSVPMSSQMGQRQPSKVVARGSDQRPTQQSVRKHAESNGPRISLRVQGSKGPASGGRAGLPTQSQAVHRSQSSVKLAQQPCKSKQLPRSGSAPGIKQGVISGVKGPGPKQMVGNRIQPRHPNSAPLNARNDQFRDPAKPNNRNEVKKVPPQGQPIRAVLRGAPVGQKPAAGRGGPEAGIQARAAQNDSARLAQFQSTCNRNGQRNAVVPQQSKPKQSKGLFSQVRPGLTPKNINKRVIQSNRAQAMKRRRAEEAYDDLDGFIADGEDSGDWKRELRKITRYDASRYQHIDDRDDPSMEVGWQRCQLEEHRSARSGREEDAREELLNLKRKQKRPTDI